MQEDDIVRLYKKMVPGITAKLAYWLVKLRVHENIQQLAEDMVQEAFELALKAARKFPEIEYTEKSFIWYRVRNVWNKFLKARKKQGFITQELYEEFYQSDDPNVCENLIQLEEHEATFGHVSESDRFIIELIELGYSFLEIVKITNKTPGALRTQIYRIRKIFQQKT